MSNWLGALEFLIAVGVVAAYFWISPFRPKHWCCRIWLLVAILLVMAHTWLGW